jgi:hypothetical protein
LAEIVNKLRIDKDIRRSQVMTDEEMSRLNTYISLLNENRSSMQKDYTRWAEEEEYYSNEIEDVPKRPNTKVNITCATVEGLVTQVVNPNLAVVCKGVSPEDEDFAEWGNISLEWALRMNKIHKKCSVHETRREKFGAAWIKLVWDENFAGQGLPVIMVPSLNKIFVDQKIKDFLRLEEAEFIAETINLSRTYAEDRYGKDKAALIDYGLNDRIDNGIFIEEQSSMDERNFTLIQWWSKEQGYLRLQEFTGCGVLLYDSFKTGEPKHQDQYSVLNPKPYYKYTNNYPYFLTIKYFREGHLLGFGDAKLLIPMQKLLNEMYDKLRIQMRPNLTLIDVDTDVDVDGFDDEDSFNPVPFNGKKVKGQPVWSIPWGQIGNDYWKLIDNIHNEAQKITRFSDIMTGQGNSATTATEAAIQQSQGNTHTEHEKMFLEDTLGDVCSYMIAMMMEKFVGGKAFRIAGEKKAYEWVDFEKMASIPAMKPASKAYKDKFRQFNPTSPQPEWEHVTNEKGKPIMKSVELDIEVSVGSGLPKNKAFLWQMIDGLIQKTGIDMSSGQPVQKPLVDYNEAREFIIKFLGIPLKGVDDFENFIKQFKGGQSTPNTSANAPDVNIPISNNFNPELAQPGATAPQINTNANPNMSTQATTEGMSQQGVGQEMNNGIKAGV